MAKCASRKKSGKTGESVFVQSAQTVDASRENALRYDRSASEIPIDPNGTGNQFVFNLRHGGVQYYDIETGLFYNWHRYYDPGTGRFPQSDPIGLLGGSLSTYAYGANNPLKFIDRLGLALDSIDAGIESAIVRGDTQALTNLIESGALSPAQEAAAQQGIRAIDILADSTSSTSRMAEIFGKTTRQIKRAIEVCKQKGLPRNGPVRNPDVVVDSQGNVYPQLPNGGIGDPIGNLHDYF